MEAAAAPAQDRTPQASIGAIETQRNSLKVDDNISAPSAVTILGSEMLRVHANLAAFLAMKVATNA